MRVTRAWYLAGVPDLSETLAWLVAIPSETGEEAEIRNAVADRLSSSPLAKVANSVVVGEPDDGKVLLVGHLDTVPLQGELGPRVEDGRLYGLGATDMKAGVAVMIHLMEELGPERLACVFYAGEEGPLAGNDLATLLDQVPWLASASAAVVMEPTDRGIHFGCQGGINAQVSFDGEAAHSARPWLGENAITRGAGFLAMMGELAPDPHVVGGIEFLEVMSVTRASGGIANNIIPATFDLNVNYRFAPDRSLDEAVEYLRDVCRSADRFEVIDAAPSGAVDVDHPLFDRLRVAADAAVGGKQGWTDVAQFSALGVPAVNFGPGETGLAHKPGESVRLDDLDWAYDSLLEVLR